MNGIYYLSHGGPGSGRYPLGSGDRPYQKFESGRSKRSGISGYIKSRKEKKNEEKKQKAMAEARQRAAEEAEKKQKHISDKERVLREGSASEVMKYQGELTNQELQSAFSRLNLEKQIKKLAQEDVESSMNKINEIMKNVKLGTEWVKIGTDTYNTFANIYNATSEGKKSPLTTVKK